ncbi:BMC domain-containing protein ['Paenibacillus yunnanensis' Narsing Rao et al. 2020]|uniref:BMC domain-containing protein n=1 Tax=Paenibacillus tengchongensis TaxID=2608684 RepID=UPI00124CFD1E|nr:BMC domain-containing protein [Paenibacillus tengchongensis]
MQALGLIETLGYTAAVSAADAALKAADVQLVAVEKIIGVGGSLGVTIHLSGEVAAVTSSVAAGKAEGERVGKVVSAHVIAKAHEDVSGKILANYMWSTERTAVKADAAPDSAATTAQDSPIAKAKLRSKASEPSTPPPQPPALPE